MRRPLPLACLLCLVLAAPAAANPAFSLRHDATTPLTRLPARAVSTLTMSAAGQEERFRLRSPVPLTFAGDVRVGLGTALSPAVAACPGRWQRPHVSRLQSGRFEYDLTLPAGGTGTATGTDTLVRAPWTGEDEHRSASPSNYADDAIECGLAVVAR